MTLPLIYDDPDDPDAPNYTVSSPTPEAPGPDSYSAEELLALGTPPPPPAQAQQSIGPGKGIGQGALKGFGSVLTQTQGEALSALGVPSKMQNTMFGRLPASMQAQIRQWLSPTSGVGISNNMTPAQILSLAWRFMSPGSQRSILDYYRARGIPLFQDGEPTFLQSATDADAPNYEEVELPDPGQISR